VIAATVLTVLVALLGVAALVVAVSALVRQRANSNRVAALVALAPDQPVRAAASDEDTERTI